MALPDRQLDGSQAVRQTGRQQEGAEEHRANCLHHRARISAKRRERAPANSAPSRAPSVGQHGTASPPHARRPARLPARQCAGRPGVLGPQSQRPPLPQPRRQPSSAGPAQQCWPVGQAPQPPREPQRAPPNKPLFFFHPRRAWECTMQVARERRSYNKYLHLLHIFTIEIIRVFNEELTLWKGVRWLNPSIEVPKSATIWHCTVAFEYKVSGHSTKHSGIPYHFQLDLR